MFKVGKENVEQRIKELQYADVITNQSDVCYFVADIYTVLVEGKHSGTLVDSSMCVSCCLQVSAGI